MLTLPPSVATYWQHLHLRKKSDHISLHRQKDVRWGDWVETYHAVTGDVVNKAYCPPVENFSASVSARFLPDASLCLISGGHYYVERTEKRTAQDNIDVYCIQFYCHTGGSELECSKGSFGLQSGDLIFYDATQPMSAHHADYQLCKLMLPREKLSGYISAQRSHPIQIFRGNSTPLPIIRQLMLSLSTEINTLTDDQYTSIVDCIAELVGQIVSHQDNENSSSTLSRSVQHLRRLQAKGLLRHNLSNPDLSSDDLAHLMGISRSTLYRLLDPMGGFAKYLRTMRLARARQLLRLQNRKEIGELAEACGFKHLSTFSKVFRSEFDMSPSEMLNELHRSKGTPLNTYIHWAKAQ
ncbi:Transcriptional activator NphR [Pseudovibrio sp. Ad5]|nr:Transcriptional activator NphR [Pseudovibrio sp. Ad5]